jgi:hypothetical protein
MRLRRPQSTVPVYRVTRGSDGPGLLRIALVRRAPLRDDGINTSAPQEIVLAQRTFKPGVDLFALEAYAAQLERAAEHGNRGTLGCFVQVSPLPDGTVSVTLYERWFRGKYLLCEQLASRRFDASGEDARAASVAYLLDLRDQAARRNHERLAAAAELDTEAIANAHGSNDPVPAAEQLAEQLDEL